MRIHSALFALAMSATCQAFAGPLHSDSENSPPFSYYTATQMQQLAAAFVARHKHTQPPDTALLIQAAEFRGYILAKAESWNKDWRGTCDGPAGQHVEPADSLALQIATIVANTPAAKIAEAGETNVDRLVGWGVFSRCMPDSWK